MGIGMASTERIVYDPQNGVAANVGFHQAKPPSYLDVPATMEWGAVDIADPQSPMGTRGMGEPCAGRTLFQSHTDCDGHDRERSCRAGTVTQTVASRDLLSRRQLCQKI